MESDAGNGGAVGLESVSCGGSWQPARGVLVLAEEGCGSRRVELTLEALVSLFEFQDLRV